MKKLKSTPGFLFLTILVLPPLLQAQTISQAVIGTTGSINDRLSYTVGESLISTGEGADLVLTQGFHQPSTTSVTSVEDPGGRAQLTLFPNPTSGQVTLHVETEGRHRFQLELMSLDGKRLAPLRVWEVFANGQTTVDLGAYPSGIYLLNLRDQVGGKLRTFRIRKAE